MPYYPSEPPGDSSSGTGLMHTSGLSIRLALGWAGWLVFCLVVIAPVVLKLVPGSGGSIHRWLYHAAYLGCLAFSVGGAACAVWQLNSNVRPRSPVYAGLVVCIVLVLASHWTARVLADTARSTLSLQKVMPWNRSLDKI
jgi:hypothetical protein